MDKKHISYFIFGVLGFFILIFAWWGISRLTQVKTGVEFIVAPDDITVKYGGENFKVKYETKKTFEPGEYILEFSKDGFESQTQTVTVEPNNIAQVYILMSANTDEAQDLLDQNIMQPRIERITGQIVARGAIEFEEKYPFINKLPIIDRFFSIKTCRGEENVLLVCAYLSVDNQLQRNRANDAAVVAGIDLEKFPLVFIVSESH